MKRPPRTCRVCGCTDRRGCPGGCSWVEADLCTRCVPRPVGVHEPDPPKDDYEVVVAEVQRRTGLSIFGTILAINCMLRLRDIRLELVSSYPSGCRVVPMRPLAELAAEAAALEGGHDVLAN